MIATLMVSQATTLLTMNKSSVGDAKDIRSSCFRLNSLQLRALLGGYGCANSEPRVPPVSAARANPQHHRGILSSC